MNFPPFVSYCVIAVFAVLVLTLIIQIVRFPALFWDYTKGAFVIWILIGVVSLFMKESKLTFLEWFVGAGTMVLFGLCIWFLIVSFIVSGMFERSYQYGPAEPELEYVQGEVMPDDGDRIWDEGRILAAKSGRQVQKGIVRR